MRLWKYLDFSQVFNRERVWRPLPSLTAVMPRQILQTWTSNSFFDFEISTTSPYHDSPFYQFDAQIIYFNTYITLLYMFRVLLCSSSGDSCITTASGIVTLFGWLFSTQVTRGLYYISLHVSSTIVLIFRGQLYYNSIWYRHSLWVTVQYTGYERTLLHSSTCFEHYCAHLQEDSCINTASGIVTLFGW